MLFTYDCAASFESRVKIKDVTLGETLDLLHCARALCIQVIPNPSPPLFTFFVMAFGSVPNCGASAGRSTGLFISDGTDSVLLILATGKEDCTCKHAACEAQVRPLTPTLKSHSVGRRSCRKGPPSYTCCGTLTCTQRVGWRVTDREPLSKSDSERSKLSTYRQCLHFTPNIMFFWHT